MKGGNGIPYTIINLGGMGLVIIWVISYILYAKGKLRSKTFHIFRAIFGAVMIVLGFYVLSVADTLQRIYPQKHYSVGAWIVIVLGILVLLSFFWRDRKSGK
jgi:hypothetical protein